MTQSIASMTVWHPTSCTKPGLNRKVLVYDQVNHTAYKARLKIDEVVGFYWKACWPFKYQYAFNGHAINRWKYVDDDMVTIAKRRRTGRVPVTCGDMDGTD